MQVFSFSFFSPDAARMLQLSHSPSNCRNACYVLTNAAIVGYA
jgi:hypothetical protein